MDGIDLEDANQPPPHAKKKSFRTFKNFDTISKPPRDHHYIKSKTSTPSPQKIRTEWEILETSLPGQSIFVRAYEKRIDLMRAAMVGPHRGLFFFDIHFPTNYPAQPPEVFHRCHDLALGRHLLSSGKVYLTLLNTRQVSNVCSSGKVCPSVLNNREGRPRRLEWNPKWNPEQSTVLDVLLSIRRFGFDGEPDCDEHAPAFLYRFRDEEDVFMRTCEAMSYTLERPPKQFEDLVVLHFREHAQPILMNFRERMIISTPTTCRLFLKLAKVFKANGACCDQALVGEVKNEEKALKEKNKKIWNKAMVQPLP